MNKIIFSIDEWKTLENVISENVEVNDYEKTETNENYSLIDDFTYNISDCFYELNVNNLKNIMKYYKISYGRMKKTEIIQTLISFEMNVKNDDIVKRRRRYWQYIYELLNDDIMSEYIQNF